MERVWHTTYHKVVNSGHVLLPYVFEEGFGEFTRQCPVLHGVINNATWQHNDNNAS